jgi:DNA-binding transcriptional ArsR family regulator
VPNKAQPVRGNARGRDLQKVMSALSSPIRREILGLIWDREVSAGDIAAAFSVTKPTISQHLAVLRQAGLATCAVAGTSRLYRARPEALRGLNAALSDSGKWSVADDLPERALSSARTKLAVVVGIDVETDQEQTFRAFLDPNVYSRWLGVPVRIEGGRFACTMEWGTNVRGRYDVISPPELLAMRWDFDDNNVPVPGGEMTAYLRVSTHGRGSHVEVHQLVEDAKEAEFMEAAWSFVLGRLKSGVVGALDPDAAMPGRLRRAKKRAAS